MRIRNVDFVEEFTERPRMRDGRPSMHKDDESTFTANEVDEELEESIDDEGLCVVSFL